MSARERSVEKSEEFVDELKPGTKLLQGQYTIVRFLNAGGFGITYLAKNSLDREVVIKECFPGSFCRRSRYTVTARSSSHEGEFAKIVKLFVQEAKSLSRLIHPNIVGVHQVFEDNNTAYMAIDYVAGRDLLWLIENDRESVRPAQVMGMLRKLLGAIAFIHDNGMLHRDISPDNILVNEAGDPILIDFGAARQQATVIGGKALSALRVVKDGYSPQEFYVGGSVQSNASDLYALAATFYHLITGEVPPSSQTRLVKLAETGDDPYQPLSGRVDGYPEDFLTAIDTAINVLPRDRLQTARDWLDRIGKRPELRVVHAEPATGGTGQPSLTSAASNGGQAPRRKSKKPVTRSSGAAQEMLTRGIRMLSLACGTAAAIISLTFLYTVLPIAPMEAPESASEVAVAGSASDADVKAQNTPASVPDVSEAQTLAVPPVPQPVVGPDASEARSEGEAATLPTTEEALAAPEAPAAAVPDHDEPTPRPTPAALPANPPEQPLSSPVIPTAPRASSTAATSQAAAPAVSARQVQGTYWEVTLPFRAAATQDSGSFPEILEVTTADQMPPENDWVQPGVVIYRVNGALVGDAAAIRQSLSNVTEVGATGHLLAAARIKTARAEPFQNVTLAVEGALQTVLTNGTRFSSAQVDGSWQTSVTGVPAVLPNGLRPGDILVAERTTGLAVDTAEALEAVLAGLVGSATPVATFEILRDGVAAEAKMPLAQDGIW